MAVADDVDRILVLEAGPSSEALIEQLEAALSSGARFRTSILCREARRESTAELSRRFPTVEVVFFDGDSALDRLASAVERDAAVAFLPAESAFVEPPWDDLPPASSLVLPYVPRSPLPLQGSLEHRLSVAGWVMRSSLLQTLRDLRLPSPTLPRLAAAACGVGRPLRFGSVRADADPSASSERAGARPVLATKSSVLAVIPHHRCEEWLDQCLSSLVTQTRELQGIVVVDDGSPSPPTAIAEKFPTVTLLRSATNVGPYRLIDSVIRDTRYDAYLFQDADDWSTADRLELLLAAAEESGAELVGCQELKVTTREFSPEGAFPVTYPLDVNRALALEPTHALVHPSSLVARSLLERLGGFASALRFGGDTEFSFRAAHVARIVNVERFCYFTRIRPGSLTTAEDTRAKSPARRELGREIVGRARENYVRVARGEPPDLRPLRVADPVPLEHVAGPALVRG